METVYASIKKNGGKIHLLDTNGKTLCQVENCGSKIFGTFLFKPPDRKVCLNCIALETMEPSLKVLMGEEMA